MGDRPGRARSAAVVVLLSGGLDSAVALAMARQGGQVCHALSVDYGQRHRCELEAARRVARQLGAREHRIVRVDLRAIGGSALTDDRIDVPVDRGQAELASGIPATYVPARNLLLLSIAAGWCEVLGARDVYIGVNAIDYSGYPDCRPAFIEAFQQAVNIGTKSGVEGHALTIHTPLIAMTKAQIIRRGVELGVDFSQTVSCYQPDEAGRACGRCDACQLRRHGFAEAGVADPTRYVPAAGSAPVHRAASGSPP